MGPSKAQRSAMDVRRRTIATLHLAHVTQEEIAKQMAVTRQTVASDLAHLRRLWQKELMDDPVAQKAQELAELSQMEREAAGQFAATRETEWLALRLRIKERRAKLLGLDSAAKTEHLGPGGGPVAQAVTITVQARFRIRTGDGPS